MAKFQIRRCSPNEPISGTLPSDVTAVIGTAYKILTKDVASTPNVNSDPGVNTLTLADGYSDGFITRPVRTTPGRTPDELLFGLVNFTVPSSLGDLATSDGEVMTPFLAGASATVEDALAVEAESPDNVCTSGSGGVTTGTAVGTKLSFTGGKFYVAQTGDFAQYRLVKQMTPDVAGCVRIYAEKISGDVV